MRTKALLLTAAIGAAGIATSMAQVYSVNAVGYVNLSLAWPAGTASPFAIVANPLNGTDNLISTVIPTAPDGTIAYLFRGGVYEIIYYTSPGWSNPSGPEPTIAPGEAFFLGFDGTVAPNPTVITFVGEVPQGNLTNSLPTGFSMRSSIVPQSGGVTTVLGLNSNEPVVDSDLLFDYNVSTQAYDIYYGLGAAGWAPSEPVIPVAKGFFYQNNGTATLQWGRTFTVN